MLSVRSVMLPVSLSPYFFQCIVYQYGYRKVCNKVNNMEQEYIVPFVDFCLIVIVHYLFASTIMLIIKVYKNQYPIVGPFVTAGLGVADAIWGEQLYDWVDDNF